MKHKIKNIFLFFIIILFNTSFLQAQEVSPQAIVLSLWKTFYDSSNFPSKAQDVSFIKKTIKDNFDFTSFYELALQDHWSRWSQEQRLQFSQKFEIVFISNLVEKIKNHQKDVQLVVQNTSFQIDKKATVDLAIHQREDRFEIKVFFIKSNVSWLIYDIEVEGALLSRNHRGQFNRILRKESFEGLMARIDSKLKEIGGEKWSYLKNIN